MKAEEQNQDIQEVPSSQLEETVKTSPVLTFFKKNPQYIFAFLFFIAGLFVKLSQNSPIDPYILKIWALATFALGCFFPFVITAIASRQSLQRMGKSYYFIISLIALFSLSFGLGEWVAKKFILDFFNIAFIAYGTGGYIGVLLSRLLSKKRTDND